jgi:hypothetical protein
MARDDVLDAYIAAALTITGTRKSQPPDAKASAAIAPPGLPPVTRAASGTKPPPLPRPRSASAQPPSVAARMPSPPRTPPPLPPSDFTCEEDTIPDARAFSALTDQDDRGVPRS